jgi:hypothetical protein
MLEGGGHCEPFDPGGPEDDLGQSADSLQST